MNIQTIEKVAEAVRNAVLKLHQTTSGKCCASSHAIATLCRELNIPATVVRGFIEPGRETWLHWWVIIEDTVVDVTVDQFNSRMLFDGSYTNFPGIVIADKNDCRCHVKTSN